MYPLPRHITAARPYIIFYQTSASICVPSRAVLNVLLVAEQVHHHLYNTISFYCYAVPDAMMHKLASIVILAFVFYV